MKSMSCFRAINLVVVSILVFAVSSCASNQKTSFSAKTNDFGVNIFLVSDPDEFLKMWYKPEPPKITKLKSVAVGSKFSGVIIYWGGGRDKNGNCNIQVKAKVMAGNKLLTEGQPFSVCEGQAPKNPLALSLGNTILDFKAVGRPISIVVYAEVTDRINNETLKVSVPIEVVQK